MNRISLHKKHFCIPIRAFIYSPWAYLYTSILKIDIRGALTRLPDMHCSKQAAEKPPPSPNGEGREKARH